MHSAKLDLAGAGAGAGVDADAGGAGDGVDSRTHADGYRTEAPRPPQLVQDKNGEWPCDLCNGKVCGKSARPHKLWQLTESLVSLAVLSAGNCSQEPEARNHANCVLLHSQRRIQHGKRRSPSIAVQWGFSPAYRQAPAIGILASTRAKATAQGEAEV